MLAEGVILDNIPDSECTSFSVSAPFHVVAVVIVVDCCVSICCC